MDSQTLADFEPDVGNNPYELWNRIGQLFSCCGTPCGHPEGERRYASAGDSNGNGSDCADGREALARTRTGTALSSGFLRVSTKQVGTSGPGTDVATVLARGLGAWIWCPAPRAWSGQDLDDLRLYSEMTGRLLLRRDKTIDLHIRIGQLPLTVQIRLDRAIDQSVFSV